MANVIVIVTLVLILVAATVYVFRAKRNAPSSCIGCPHRDTCASRTCGCGRKEQGAEQTPSDNDFE